MTDERPIKPDKKYLEDYIQKISKIEKKEYLKKQSSPILPCYAHQLIRNASLSPKHEDRRSKAVIYEEIKRKNREKFGDKKIEPVSPEKIKKIDPKKMTVNYRPTNKKVKIETDDYKKQGFIKKTVESKKQANQKVEYEKLLDYFKREMITFEREKEEFQKVANKLKFKDMIEKEEGLSYSKIKSQVERNLITQTLSCKSQDNEVGAVRECKSDKNSKEKDRKLKTIRECDRPHSRQQNNFSKTFSIGQIRACMNETNEKLKSLKDQLLNRELIIKEHRYDISQIHLLPEFTPQSVFDFIDPQKLKYSSNDLYKKALAMFNSKLNRENQEEGNSEEVEKDQKNERPIKVRHIGQKRVTKYQGWTEVWIPGKQRLMTNNEGYKVVWLSNGDVLQEFGNQIKTYYSKAKQILKIDFNQFSPVYYHYGLNQTWRVLDNNSREIVFGNGRKEIVEEKIESLL